MMWFYKRNPGIETSILASFLNEWQLARQRPPFAEGRATQQWSQLVFPSEFQGPAMPCIACCRPQSTKVRMGSPTAQHSGCMGHIVLVETYPPAILLS